MRTRSRRWAPEGFSIESVRAAIGPMPAFEPVAPSSPGGFVLPSTTALPTPPAKRGKGPEATVQAAIIRALEKRGWRVKRRSVGFDRERSIRFGEPGEPDLEVLPGHGLVVFLEVKAEKGRVSEAQQRWHERHRADGYVVEVVRSVDEALAAVEKALGVRR